MHPQYSGHKINSFPKKSTLNLDGRLVKIDKPLIMAILNLSADSFYRLPGQEDKHKDTAWIIPFIESRLEYTDILDIGAVSTRPGSKGIPAGEEGNRIKTALVLIKKHFPALPCSVDTYRSEVARIAVDHGAAMINDISGGMIDREMIPTLSRLKVPYVLMHMQGTPETMQQNPVYGDIVKEICLFFSRQVTRLYEAGVNDIILDPGFGFGKTMAHNYALLHRLEEFKAFGLPLLVGLSRKSMIQKLLNVTATDALIGTSAVNLLALLKGADILRVHDPAEACQVRDIFCYSAKITNFAG